MAVYDKEDSHEFHDTLVREAVDEEQQALEDLYDSPSAGSDEGYYQRGKDYARESAAQSLQEKGLIGGAIANKFRGKKTSSGLGKKIGLGALGIVLPGMLFTFMLFGLQTGLRIEQVDRISTAVRFGNFHRQLSSRLKHLAATSASFEGDVSSASTTYQSSSVARRFLTGGFSAGEAIKSLGLDGDFRVDTDIGLTGRRISSITDTRTGRVYDASNLADLQAWQDVADQRLVGEAARGRFFTRRTTNYVFKRAALPFTRYQALISDLRSGAATTDVVKSRIAVQDLDVIEQKTRSVTVPAGGDEAVEEIQEAIRNGTDPDVAKANIARRLRASEAIFSATSKASLATSIGTFTCVARSVAGQIEDAFRLRVEGSQSSAAKVKTLTSQRDAGNIHPAIIDEVSQDLSGFQNSATYKAGSGRADEISDIYDFSDRFSNVRVYGIPLSFVFQVSDFVDSVTGAQFLEAIPLVGEEVADFTGESVDQVCENVLLTTEGQIAIAGVEVVGTLVASFFSGGAAGGATQAARTTLTTFLSSVVSTRFIATTATSIAFEQFFFSYLLPEIIDNTSGLETVFSANTGEQNYASIDYGMHYLKEADCLANGCSRLPVEEFIAGTEQTLALHRQEYSDQGLWSNIASTDNPYSVATDLAVNAPATISEGIQTTAATLGSLFNPGAYGSLLGLSSASAQSLDANLLIPGQTTSLGFSEDEINGTAEGFSHIENTEFVINNFDELSSAYAGCLNIDVVDYLLAEAGVDPDENYPEECDTERARRYKIYYQDCLAIEQVIASANEDSSFFNESCAHIAPGQTIDATDNRVSQNIELLAIAATERDADNTIDMDGGAPVQPNYAESLAAIFISWRG